VTSINWLKGERITHSMEGIRKISHKNFFRGVKGGGGRGRQRVVKGKIKNSVNTRNWDGLKTSVFDLDLRVQL